MPSRCRAAAVQGFPDQRGEPWLRAVGELLEERHRRPAAAGLQQGQGPGLGGRVHRERPLQPLHRARNMSDGKASLTRAELDQILDHLPMLESEGFELRLPGIESMQRLSAHVTLEEVQGSDGSPRPW